MPEYLSKPQDFNSTEIITCVKQTKTELTDLKDLQVIISNPELIKNGFFSFSFFQFTLSSPQLKTNNIIRKLSDFYWLREKLVILFPTESIPPIPNNIHFKNPKSVELQRGVYYMQLFLNSWIKTKLIRSSTIFKEFVTLNLGVFNKVKASYDKSPPIVSLCSITTKTGIIELKINKDIEKKAQNISDDITLKTTLYNKVNATVKEWLGLMNSANAKFKELSTIFEALNVTYSKSKVMVNNDWCNSFESLANIFSAWSAGYKKQIEFFNPNIKHHFKYIKKELKEFENVVEEYKTSRNTYNDYKGKTKVKKTEWLSIRNYYGWYMNKVVNKYTKLQENQGKRTKMHFETWDQKKEDLIQDYTNFVNLLKFKTN